MAEKNDRIAEAILKNSLTSYHVVVTQIQARNIGWDSVFGTPLMLFPFHWLYGKRPDCCGARLRENHSQSKLICSVITVHFQRSCPTFPHWNSTLYVDNCSTMVVCLFTQKPFPPYMYGNLQQALQAHPGIPKQKIEESNKVQKKESKSQLFQLWIKTLWTQGLCLRAG